MIKVKTLWKAIYNFFQAPHLYTFNIRDQLYLIISTLLMLEPNDLASTLIEKATRFYFIFMIIQSKPPINVKGWYWASRDILECTHIYKSQLVKHLEKILVVNLEGDLCPSICF